MTRALPVSKCRTKYPPSLLQAAVTDIQVVSNGFLTCGGDGIVKYIGFQGNPLETTN